MMLTTRFWGGKAVLLCTLLLQNCQSTSLRVTEEGGPASDSSSASAMRQRASGEPSAALSSSLTPLSASSAAHVPPSRVETTPANENPLSTAPSSHPLSPPASYTLTTVGNSPIAPHGLQPALMPKASHAVPLGNTPGHAPSPDGPRVYLGKVGLLEEMPGDEEDAKPTSKRQSSNPDNELAQGNKKARDVERREQGCIRRDALNILLDVAGSEPNKAAELLKVSLAATKNKQFRQQALEALGKVAKASPDMVSACLPSLRAAAWEGGDKAVRLLALRALGGGEWRHYFGDVGPIPALPSDMDTILGSTCPFWPERKVRDTHLLVLMPATVDGAPFTLNLLGELIQRPKNGGYETRYSYCNNRIRAQLGEESLGRSYWLLMTHDILEGSRSKSYSDQRASVANYAKRTGLLYEIPSVLEAATAVLMHYVRTEERLFGDNPWTYTRCQEAIDGKYPAVVGGFESSGLDVSRSNYNDFHCGVAGCWKFYEGDE